MMEWEVKVTDTTRVRVTIAVEVVIDTPPNTDADGYFSDEFNEAAEYAALDHLRDDPGDRAIHSIEVIQ